MQEQTQDKPFAIKLKEQFLSLWYIKPIHYLFKLKISLGYLLLWMLIIGSCILMVLSLVYSAEVGDYKRYNPDGHLINRAGDLINPDGSIIQTYQQQQANNSNYTNQSQQITKEKFKLTDWFPIIALGIVSIFIFYLIMKMIGFEVWFRDNVC
jgi:hypothetical protein